MKEAVKAKVVKLLDKGIIYLISYSSWVSQVHVVSKKKVMIVVPNEKNEMILTRAVIGWRMYINYQMLNDAIPNDHFPLSFIDHMFE